MRLAGAIRGQSPSRARARFPVGLSSAGEQSSAYIASWLRVLDDEGRLVVVVAAQGQCAANHILGAADAVAFITDLT